MSSKWNCRCQISLRFTLLLICLLGCFFAYLADVKRRQEEVKNVVHELGGYVENTNFDRYGAGEPSRLAFLPDFFYVVLPERLNYVYVTSPAVDDEKLARILRLPGIEGLNISRSTITIKGLAMLKRMPRLREIQVYGIPTVSKEAILEFKASMGTVVNPF